jgi:hypothetical protein
MPSGEGVLPSCHYLWATVGERGPGCRLEIPGVIRGGGAC